MDAAKLLILVAVLVVCCAGPVRAQSAPNMQQPKGHSGVDEGRNGPNAPTPAPPPGNPTNPEIPSANGAKLQTLTGVVSDSFCGRKHYQLSGATPAECTRYCIAHRGTYALVVGDKVYALQNDPGHTLDALAGQRARVTGSVNGNTVEIRSVSAVGSNAP